MDKNTLSNYGWIVIAVLVLSVMIALATPFGEYIKAGVESTTAGLFETQQSALEAAGIIDNTEYIELSSEEDIYAISRVLACDQIKYNHFGSSYAIKDDLDNFEYPSELTSDADKIQYLSTASYKLTSNISLTLQQTNDTNYFMGIGSTQYPFKGIFNGNQKTVTLSSNDNFKVNGNSDNNIGMFGYTENATIKNLNVVTSNDLIVRRATKPANIGLLIGNSQKSHISNCNATITDATVGVNYSSSETYVNISYVGGLVGSSTKSITENCTVNLVNSTLQAKGFDVDSDATYGMFSVGGLIGNSASGSNNTDNIGAIGTQIYNCKVISKNTTQTDVIIATVETGDELCAGGLVGMSYNNAVIKNCSVDIEKGNIVARKTGEIDNAKYGTQVGGIIGRLEHTGEIYNCNVNGNYLNIESQSNNTVTGGDSTTAGGIAGYAFGAYHRNVIALNKCSFNGNNTSTISAKTTTTTGRALAGGLAGYVAYKVADCNIKNVTISNQSPNSAKSFVGKLIGFWSDHNGYWMNGTYFTPDAPEIINSTTENVITDVTSNVVVGEIYGRT